jgi:3' terminal RNA ribose 2'-O-methyltransferase Hen1
MRRLGSVVAALKNCRARSVIDIGCGEGNLLRMLSREKQFERIAGTDVSCLMLERAREKLKLIDSPNNRFYIRSGDKDRTYHDRINLFQSSLTYKDARFKGYDAACVIEVIEHLDPSRLSAFERVLFDFTKPRVIILTTPNKEYNVKYENIGNNKLRHSDHRFEWTRAEFKDWAEKTASQFGYSVKFSGSGDADEELGAPTQMGVFTLCQ